MHFKWEKPYRIRHRIEKIKSWTMRINLNSRKVAEFIPNFKNSPCIFKEKIQIWHRIEKVLDHEDHKNKLEYYGPSGYLKFFPG